MVIYYHHDNDGYGSGAIIYNNAIQNGVDSDSIITYAVDYVKPLPGLENLVENEKVYLVDYSIKSPEQLQWVSYIINVKHCHIIWIDHHLDSLVSEKEHPELLSQVEGIRNVKYAGVVLCFCYIMGYDPDTVDYNRIPETIRYIDQHDRWDKMNPNADFLFYGISSIDGARDVTSRLWRMLTEMFPSCTVREEIREIIEKGKAVSSYINNIYTARRKHCEVIRVKQNEKNYIGLLLNSATNSSVFGDLAHKYDFVMVYARYAQAWKYSIFNDSPSEFKCNEFANQFGGGGHLRAAGFSEPELVHFEVIGDTNTVDPVWND